MKVKITWEHGDASFQTNTSFKMSKETLPEFLNFLYDMREWIPKKDKSRGHFQDGHYQKEIKHVDAINKKYEYKFEEYLEPDQKYNYPRASIEEISLKDGNKMMHIAWTKCLKENAIQLPKIGEVLTITSGKVSGHNIFGGKRNEYLGYDDLCQMGYGLKWGKDSCDANEYPKLDVIVKDIRIDFSNRKRYHYEYTEFKYIILCEFEGQLLTTTMDGYDKTFDMGVDFLYFH